MIIARFSIEAQKVPLMNLLKFIILVAVLIIRAYSSIFVRVYVVQS